MSLSLLSFSLYRPYMCVWREKECWSCTHTLSLLQSYTHRETQTHTISCCSITGRWILFIMALRSCFLLHSMGLARKPAYALSSRAMIGFFLFRTTHTHIHASPAVALFSFSLIIHISFHTTIYIVLKNVPIYKYTRSAIINLIQNFKMHYNIMVMHGIINLARSCRLEQKYQRVLALANTCTHAM